MDHLDHLQHLVDHNLEDLVVQDQHLVDHILPHLVVVLVDHNLVCHLDHHLVMDQDILLGRWDQHIWWVDHNLLIVWIKGKFFLFFFDLFFKSSHPKFKIFQYFEIRTTLIYISIYIYFFFFYLSDLFFFLFLLRKKKTLMMHFCHRVYVEK